MRVRIVTTSYPHVGGIAAIVRVLGSRTAQDYDAEIFCLNRRRGRWQEGDVSVVAMGTGRLNQALFPFMWLTLARTFVALVARQVVRPAVVLVSQDGYAVGLATGLAARMCRVRHVQMDHGTATNMLDRQWEDGTERRLGGPSTLRGRLFRLGRRSRRMIVHLAPRVADRVVCGGYELGDLYDELAIPAQRRSGYAHLIDTRLFRPVTAEERAEVRASLRVPDEATLAIVSGRLDEEKGLEWSVPAIAAALQDDPRLHVLVVGHGSRGAWVWAQLSPFADEGRATVLDPAEPARLHRLLGAADVQVYSGEVGCGFSIALLEGMACGCVPIATPVPRAHADVITPQLGWVVPVGDHGALTAALLAAADDKVGLAQRAAACQRHVVDNHDAWGRAGAELLRVIAGP